MHRSIPQIMAAWPIILVVAATLSFGAVTEAAQARILAALGLWVALSALTLPKSGVKFPFWALSALLLTLVGVQLMPLPDAFYGAEHLALFEGIPRGPRFSLTPEITAWSGAATAVFLGALWASWHGMAQIRSRHFTVKSIVFLALFTLFLALLQRLMGTAHPLLLPSTPAIESKRFFGSFINANHGALLLAVGMLLSLHLALPHRSRGRSQPLYLPIALALFLGLLATGSLGAILALLAAQGLTLILYFGPRRPWVALGLAISALGGFVFFLTPWGQRALMALAHFLGAPHAGIERRIALWVDILTILPAHLPWGTGWGSFTWVSPNFYTGREWLLYSHAHFDYLEILLEGGILALAAAFAGLWALIQFFSRHHKHRRPLATAYLMGAAALPFFHALVDFPLHIPALLLMSLLILSAALRSWMAHGRGETPSPAPQFLRPAAGLLIALVGLYPLVSHGQGSRALQKLEAQLDGPLPADLNIGGENAEGNPPALKSDLDASILAQSPVDDLLRLSYGQFLRASEDIAHHQIHLKRALDLAEAARHRLPTHARAHRLLGWTHFYLGDIPSAEHHLKEACALAPADPHYALYLARFYRLNRQIEAAKAAYRQALAIADANRAPQIFDELYQAWPDLEAVEALLPAKDWQSRAYFSQWARQRGLWKFTQSALLKAHELDEGNIQIIEDLFQLALQKGDLDAAKVWQVKLEKLSPEDGSAYLARGDLLYAQEKWRQSLAYYRQARNMNPSPGAQVRILRSLYALEAWQQTQKEALLYLKKYPRQPWHSDYQYAELRRYLAHAYNQMGAYDAAWPVIDKAALDGPKLAAVALVYADTLLGMGQGATALMHLSQHPAAQAKEPAFCLAWGELALKMGDEALAKRAYQAALDHPSTRRAARQALGKITEKAEP